MRRVADENNVLIEYVREDNTPIGVVVAIDRDRIGFSKKNPKDQWNKNLGKKIAIGRARSKELSVKDILELPEKDIPLFQEKIQKIYDRAQRYYK